MKVNNTNHSEILQHLISRADDIQSDLAQLSRVYLKLSNAPPPVPPVRFFLAQDYDNYWWIVPVDRRADWEAWLRKSLDGGPFVPPNFAYELNNISDLEFSAPRVPYHDLETVSYEAHDQPNA